MKLRVVFFFFLLSFFSVKAEKISRYTEISLLTCASGKQLYSAFGHSAIRIKDPINRIDRVYNYGTFSFETPYFYLKFIRGQLNYQLSVSTFSQFMYEYQYEKRAVKAQVLELTFEQKQAIFDFLENNALPENMFYLYDFFFDNCATRIRDIFPKVIGESFAYDTTFYQHRTFRHLYESYLDEKQWAKFGINLLLGMPTEKIATAHQSMFLPDYMQQAFAGASVGWKNEKTAFVGTTKQIYAPKISENEKKTVFSPLLFFWLLFVGVLLLTGIGLLAKKNFKAIDLILFNAVGLLGALLVFMWVGTEHKVVVKNWHLAWALPSHLLAGIFLLTNKWRKILKPYFGITCLSTLCFLVLLPFNPQSISPVVIPILLMIILRTWHYYFYYKAD